MKKIYNVLMWMSLIFGSISSLYVGGYQMFVKPIIECLVAFDLNTLTAKMIGITILKCLFAGTIGGAIFAIFYLIALVFLYMGGE